MQHTLGSSSIKLQQSGKLHVVHTSCCVRSAVWLGESSDAALTAEMAPAAVIAADIMTYRRRRRATAVSNKPPYRKEATDASSSNHEDKNYATNDMKRSSRRATAGLSIRSSTVADGERQIPAGPSTAATAVQSDDQLHYVQQAGSLQELQSIVNTFNQQTPPAALALAIKLAFKLVEDHSHQQQQLSEQLLHQSWQLQQEQLQYCSASDLALMIRALCKAPPHITYQYTPAVMQQLVPAFLQHVEAATSKDVAIVLHALSKAQLHLTADDFQCILQQFIRVLPSAVPQSVCMVLWAAAQLQQAVQQQQLQHIMEAFLQMQPPVQSVKTVQAAVRRLGYRGLANKLFAARAAAREGWVGEPRTAAGQHAPLASNPKLLTSRICNCKQLLDLQELLQQHRSSMNSIHLAAVMQQVVQLVENNTKDLPGLEQLFGELWLQQSLQLDSCRPSAIANMMMTFISAPIFLQHQHPDAVLQQLLPAFMRQLLHAGCKETVQVLYCIARECSRHPEGKHFTDDTVQPLLQQFWGHREAASAWDIATVLQVMSRLGHCLQEQQLSQLLSIFTAKEPSEKDVSSGVAALQQMGLQQHAIALQEKLLGPPQQNLRPRELTNVISSCRTLKQLSQQVQQEAAAFNNIHIAAAMKQAVKLSCNNSNSNMPGGMQLTRQQQAQENRLLQLLQQLWHLQEPQLSNCSNSTLASMVESLCSASAAVQQTFWPAVTNQLVPAILQRQDRHQANACATVLHAAACLALQDQQTQQQLPNAQAHHLVNALLCNNSWRRLTVRELCQVIWSAPILQQNVPAEQLQQMLGEVLDAIAANSQISVSSIAKLLKGLATLGHAVSERQLQQLLDAFLSRRRAVTIEASIDVLWAVAELGHEPTPVQLHQLLAGLQGGDLHTVSFAALVDATWACAKFRYLRTDLLSDLRLATGVYTATGKQAGQIAWACAELGWEDEQLVAGAAERLLQLQQQAQQEDQQRVTVQSPSSLGAGNEFRDHISPLCSMQDMTDVCWALAVLDYQQHMKLALGLMIFIIRQWEEGAADIALQQLRQVQSWIQAWVSCNPQRMRLVSTLMGLSSLLQQAIPVAGSPPDDATFNARSQLREAVAATLQQLPVNWKRTPELGQYVASALARVDVVAETTTGEKLALVIDSSKCFREPDGKPLGSLLCRNRALANEFKVLSIVLEEWLQLEGDMTRQQEYLLHRIKLLRTPSPPAVQPRRLAAVLNLNSSL